MKIWLRTFALWCPEVGGMAEIAAFDDGSGFLWWGDGPPMQVSMQPGGFLEQRDTSKGQGNGPWEHTARVAGINLYAYLVNGVPMKVPYRER